MSRGAASRSFKELQCQGRRLQSMAAASAQASGPSCNDGIFAPGGRAQGLAQGPESGTVLSWPTRSNTVNSADVGLDWNFLCVFSVRGPFGSGFDLGHQLYSTASRN